MIQSGVIYFHSKFRYRRNG